MAEPARADIRYTAFLSYSHRDAAAAARLHRRLESYRVPKRLVGSNSPRGPVPQRLWPIFRDREELPAASDLSETVRTALAQSGALIILCSPSAAGSLWVAEEIETFRKLHPDRPILAAILDGDPPDCFPAALRAFGRDGTWHEPLATDLRPRADGRHLGLLKLVAGITGVGLDDLVQRDAARRIRRVTAVTVGALIMMVAMAALAVVALQARREADRQRVEAKGLADFMLNDLREKLRGVGRLDIMSAVNERALAFYDRQVQSRNLPEDALMRARTLLAIGEDEINRGHVPSATATFRTAHRATEQLLAEAPNDPDRVFAHAQSEYWIGYLAYTRLNYAAAQIHFQRYKTLADRLVSVDSRNSAWLREVGYAEGNLCTIALQGYRNAQAALRSCTSALNTMERAQSISGSNPSTTLDLANRHAWLADAWDLDGHWAQARSHRGHQQDLILSLIELDPNSTDYRDAWMRSQFSLALLMLHHGHTSDARHRFRDSLTTAIQLRARDPSNVSWRDFERRIRRNIVRVSHRNGG